MLRRERQIIVMLRRERQMGEHIIVNIMPHGQGLWLRLGRFL